MEWTSKKRMFTFPQGSFLVDTVYKPTRVIGVGSHGLVCAAVNRATGREDTAIKKIRFPFEVLLSARRTLREIRLLKHFQSHDNIISLTGILKPPAAPHVFSDLYLTMDLQETDLHRIIHSQQFLSEDHVRLFVYQLLRGLKYIHSAGVVHRDIKPSNLLVNTDCSLKICDFGLSRGLAPLTDPSQITAYVATRWYRAPEILLSFESYSAAVDMWGVGCVLGELLGRSYLFPGSHYTEQLDLIVQCLGTPSAEVIQRIGTPMARDYILEMPLYSKTFWPHRFPEASPDCLDLLDRLLCFDPDERLTVEEALAHPFFVCYHNPADEPVCPPFPFESESTDLEQIKAEILKELIEFHIKSPTLEHVNDEFLFRLETDPQAQFFQPPMPPSPIATNM
eukprot:m.96573 g.96573  ORF g.96573 m.96573 type:complete len:394 (-) comp8795_c0_seq2:193-1374(-)